MSAEFSRTRESVELDVGSHFAGTIILPVLLVILGLVAGYVEHEADSAMAGIGKVLSFGGALFFFGVGSAIRPKSR